MKTLNLTIAALALSVAGIAPAFAGSSDHFDQAEYLAVAQGRTHADTVVEGRQAAQVNTGLSASDALILQLSTERDADSKR